MSKAKRNARTPTRYSPRRVVTLQRLQQPIPRATQDSAPLSLPPEIRNRIYEPLVIHGIVILQRARSVRRKRSKKPLEPAIIRTCHQMREEAAPMHYGANLFKNFLGNHLGPWWRHLDDRRRAMVRRIDAWNAPGLGKRRPAIALARIRQVEKMYQKYNVTLPKNVVCRDTDCDGVSKYLTESDIEAIMTAGDRQTLKRMEEILETKPNMMDFLLANAIRED